MAVTIYGVVMEEVVASRPLLRSPTVLLDMVSMSFWWVDRSGVESMVSGRLGQLYFGGSVYLDLWRYLLPQERRLFLDMVPNIQGRTAWGAPAPRRWTMRLTLRVIPGHSASSAAPPENDADETPSDAQAAIVGELRQPALPLGSAPSSPNDAGETPVQGASHVDGSVL